MANSAVSKFLAAVSNDKTLQSSIVQLAKQKGFDFSADDLATALRGELSDADLAGAAGGLRAFDLGIPGPTFAKVMTDGERRANDVEQEAEKASAVDVYTDLLG